jgi:hypothetical protein
LSLKGLTPVTKGYFGGAWTAPDPITVDGRGALIAQNVRFFNKQVSTRYGWGRAFTINTGGSYGAFGMYNWLSELGNYLIWPSSNLTLDGVSVKANPPTLFTFGTPVASGNVASFATQGARLYAAFAQWNGSTLSPTGPAMVISYVSPSFVGDTIIPGPATTTQIPSTAPTEPSGGIVTAGLHNLGIRMLHRSGFLGRPGPDTSTTTNPTPLTFTPTVFNSSGSKNLVWAFTPGANWPVDVVQVQVVMSPVASPNQLFLVPGAVQNVTGGAATPVSITINIDDGSLVSGAAAIESTASLDFYTASASGNAGTFMLPLSVSNTGTRMLYNVILTDGNGNPYSAILASDLGAYQNVSLDQSLVQLPNDLKVSHSFSLQGAIYIVGPHWTYVTQDTGAPPVQWPAPVIVDGRRGALNPHCVEINSSGQYAWIADKNGLFFFSGTYPELPISYNQSDIWGLIQFNQQNFTIKDDTSSHKVRVMCVLGAPYNTTKILTWDYTNGTDSVSARFSIDDPPQTFGPSGMEIVQNDLFGGPGNVLQTPELWVATSGNDVSHNAFFAREKNPVYDTLVYRDDAGPTPQAIHTIYEPPVIPEAGISWPGAGSSSGAPTILAHQAMVPRITGNGTITPVLYGIDRTVTKNFPQVTLSTSTGVRPLLRCYLKSSGFIYHFEQNTLDSFFILSDYTTYYSKYSSHR